MLAEATQVQTDSKIEVARLMSKMQDSHAALKAEWKADIRDRELDFQRQLEDLKSLNSQAVSAAEDKCWYSTREMEMKLAHKERELPAISHQAREFKHQVALARLCLQITLHSNLVGTPDIRHASWKQTEKSS